MAIKYAFPIAAVAACFGLLPWIVAMNVSHEVVIRLLPLVLAFVVSSVMFTAVLYLMRGRVFGTFIAIIVAAYAAFFLYVLLDVCLTIG